MKPIGDAIGLAAENQVGSGNTGGEQESTTTTTSKPSALARQHSMVTQPTGTHGSEKRVGEERELASAIRFQSIGCFS